VWCLVLADESLAAQPEPSSRSISSAPIIQIRSDEVALRLSAISKTFGSTVALKQASLTVRRGTVHGIIGENGAGKSTLVKIVSGVMQQDEGTLEIFGEPVRLTSPARAMTRGVATVFQELSLVPDLTVAENLFLGPGVQRPPVFLRKSALVGRARTLLDEVGIDRIDPDWLVSDLTLAEKQLVEIAKAVHKKPRLLFLDEATSALGEDAMEWFYALVNKMRAGGTTVVFISHRLVELRKTCDELTILRNGQQVGTFATVGISEAEVIRQMIGGSAQTVFPPRPAREQGPVALEVRGLTRKPMLSDVNLSVRRGEILGVAGLDGQGQLELFLTLFGVLQPQHGEVYLDGQACRMRSPRDAIAAGISFVPEDRKTEGLFQRLPVRVNVSLPALRRWSLLGFVDKGRERQAVLDTCAQINVDRKVVEWDAGALSGGNQQKIILGKSILSGARYLLLYDPTRGVDVGTKFEIYRLMRELAAKGITILFYSSELPELLNISDRIVVFYRSRIVAEFSDGNYAEEAVMAAAIGHAERSGA
jgi:ribose transport system ATP-binding protein